LIALATSKVTVPVFRVGHQGRGRGTLPSFPAERIMPLANPASIRQPFMIFCTISSPPTKSAPAS